MAGKPETVKTVDDESRVLRVVQHKQEQRADLRCNEEPGGHRYHDHVTSWEEALVEQDGEEDVEVWVGLPAREELRCLALAQGIDS